MSLDRDSKRFAFPHPDHGTEGHQASVYALDLKPPYLVSGSADRTIRIWQVESQRLVRGPLVGHEGSVICLQSDPEQDVIVSGSTDASIIIWRFSTGALVKRIFRAHEETVLDLCFDDRYILTGSKDRLVKLWHRPTAFEAEAVTTLDTHRATVNAVLMQSRADGTRLVFAGSGDRTINMWSMKDSGSQLETTHVRTIESHKQGIASMHLIGSQLVSGSSDTTAKVHDIDQGTGVAGLEGHTNIVRTMDVVEHTDQSFTIITGCYSGSIRFWRKQDQSQDPASLAQRWAEVRRLDYDGQHNPESTDAELEKRFGEGQRVFDVRATSRDGFTIVICAGQGHVIVGRDIEEAELTK